MGWVRGGILLLALNAAAFAQGTWAPDAKPAVTPQLVQSVMQRGYDPALFKAAKGADKAGCLLRVWYTAKGLILAEQILKSSGYPEIDHACFATALGQPVKAPVLLDPDDGGWVDIPIVWHFAKEKVSAQPPPLQADPAIPALRIGYPMHVRPPYYPEAALATHSHGVCKLHVTVSAAGDVDSLEVTQSTGSADLDQGCLDAIYAAPFIPAKREGKWASGTTDIVLDWRLPPVDASSPNDIHSTTVP